MTKRKKIHAAKLRKDRIDVRRKRLARVLGGKTAGKRPVAPACPQVEKKVIVFQSELDYLSRCILDFPDIETGGQLFGYWTHEGVPVVMYAIGPGPKANHQTTFFNQDVDYLVTVGRMLKARYGLHHIGEWHSHHRLGLARPSGHDAHTMNSTIREKRLGQFLLCIGNITGQTSSAGIFLCDGNICAPAGWQPVDGDNPLRPIIDRELSGILVHPRVAAPSRSLSGTTGGCPEYAPGYWLSNGGAGTILNGILTYVKERNRGADVRTLLNEHGEVQVRIEYGRNTEDILFPSGFPTTAPVIRRFKSEKMVQAVSAAGWKPYEGDILRSFIQYYRNN